MKVTGERFIPNTGMGPEIELEHKHRYLAIAPLVKNFKVLDAACGVGYGSALLAEYADQVIGIDIDPEAISYANKTYTRNNLSFVEMSIATLMFPDASFDAVISFETIEHVSEDLQKSFLQQVKRVLKPNGFFVISTPDHSVFMRRSHGTYYNPFHVKEYSFSEFNKLLAQYFPYVVMHKQGKVRCSVIDGSGTCLLNEAPDSMEGEYVIAVCSMDNKDIPVGSAFQPEKMDGPIISTLYFKEDLEYSEGNKQTVTLVPDANGLFHVNITINPSKSLSAIRFDPVEGIGCTMSDFKAFADGRACICSALNAIDNGDYLLFANTDPQIEIITSPNIQLLELSGRILLLSVDDTIKEELNYQSQKLSEQDSVIMQQQQQLSEQDSVITQRQQQLSEQDSVITQQQQQLSELDSVIAQQQTLIAMLQSNYDAISSAFFWKITGPIRGILDYFKKYCFEPLANTFLCHLKSLQVKTACIKSKIYNKKGESIEYPLTVGKQLKKYTGKDIQMFIEQCKYAGGEIFGEELLSQNDLQDRVLLVSHELNLTGAPIALQYFAESLKRLGKNPIVIAPHDDRLRQVLVNEGIVVLTHPKLFYSNTVADYASIFSIIVLSTNVCAPIVAQLNGMYIPVMWWIHEAHASYHSGALAVMPEILNDNIHVYCGGIWAQNILHQYRPNYTSNILLYSVPDLASLPCKSEFILEQSDGKMVFACVGTLEERKGQDILVDAIRHLSIRDRKKSLFVFVGKENYDPIGSAIHELIDEYPESVQYIPELSKDDLISLYKKMDCLICASKDDPMPIVVTDALALSKLVICSENTGSAALLQEMNSGLIYRNNDSVELAMCIRQLLSTKFDKNKMTAAARLTYEKYFSVSTFDWRISKLFDCMIPSLGLPMIETVSVIIPTYNAGSDFTELLQALTTQRGVETVELVIVDSGSTDDTVDIARAYGAKLIEIQQNDFSHSYARNLGVANATGKYVMMMTQDAMPNDPYWLWKMAQPIVKEKVVAVSCRQEPRSDCDIFGRICSDAHARYLGILNCNRLLSLPDAQDCDSLRKNGQLDDVSCMVVREILLQFGYRGSYAEDLDIGLRLIRAGYRLALLSSVSVIHSHTRPAYYHLKRSMVDNIGLKKILPDLLVHTENSTTCMDQIITAYVAEKMFAEKLSILVVTSDEMMMRCWMEETFTSIRSQILNMSKKEIYRRIKYSGINTDVKFQQLVLDFYNQRGNDFHPDLVSIADQVIFATTYILPFLFRECIIFDENIKPEIATAMGKYTAELAGRLLAGYAINHSGTNSYLDGVCDELSSGV